MSLCRFWVLVLFSSLILCSGCAALSESHRVVVGAFSTRVDSLALSPSALTAELAELRRQRGVLYTATLTDPQLRLAELEAMLQDESELATLKRASDLSAQLMQSYAGALKYLVHPNRYAPFGVVSRSLGRKIDGFVADYNALEWGNPLPVGYGLLAGRLVGAARMRWLRFRQAKALRELVLQGDTLVALITDNLMSSLNSKSFTDMITYEETALQTAYLTRLRFVDLHRLPALTPADDRDYLAWRDSVDALKAHRRRTVSALRSFRNAHARLAMALQKPRKFMELFEESVQFSEEGTDWFTDFLTLSPWL